MAFYSTEDTVRTTIDNVHVRIHDLWYYEMSNIRASVHGHAFGTLHICPDNSDVCVSGVQP